ncbi:hypothetical protein [Streptomyces sp. NRRL F-4474]|uniref:hypothetical protein n=1 Tax=Streptomyces sp. NRRL F-4474 TaxID=1463851 RepID=UPI000AC1E36A|nr:hypothetical protein [Streptomyces sp. NRRL F-4474]
MILANGQHDEYLDLDTVPLPDALRIVDHILTAGTPGRHHMVGRQREDVGTWGIT